MDQVTGLTRVTGALVEASVVGEIYQECPGYLVIYGAPVDGGPPRDHLFERDNITTLVRGVR